MQKVATLHQVAQKSESMQNVTMLPEIVKKVRLCTNVTVLHEIVHKVRLCKQRCQYYVGFSQKQFEQMVGHTVA